MSPFIKQGLMPPFSQPVVTPDAAGCCAACASPENNQKGCNFWVFVKGKCYLKKSVKMEWPPASHPGLTVGSVHPWNSSSPSPSPPSPPSPPPPSPPSPPSPPPPPHTGGKCTFLPDTGFDKGRQVPGHRNDPATTEQACCDLCAAIPGCAGASFAASVGQCYYKTKGEMGPGQKGHPLKGQVGVVGTWALVLE